MNKYIDIGINLMHRSFQNDRENVMKQAEAAGVSPLIITGTSVRASEQAADYAEKFPGKLYATAGVHPHDAKSCGDRTISELRSLCLKKQVVAVGECGLDYDRNFSPPDVQRKWFEEQINLAEETGLPLFLHERAAFGDFYTILKAHPKACAKSVVHCFTGNLRELESYLGLGCCIGITGWICDERRNGSLRMAVKNIPAERLMIETDAPFLTPRDLPERLDDNRNEPKTLPHTAAVIARLRGENPEDFAAKTYQNTVNFFGL